MQNSIQHSTAIVQRCTSFFKTVTGAGSILTGSTEALPERLAKVFPNYLSSFSVARLSQQLAVFRSERLYFSNTWAGPEGPLQGDAWSGLTKINFRSSDKQVISGIILSNSCDIDEDNKALHEKNIVFAPIVPVDIYARKLRQTIEDETKILTHLDAVRNQDITQIFYLPPSAKTPEAIVAFDDLSAEPIGNFAQNKDRRRLFRLNNFGFYIFMMKLSIHFTRFGEDLDRLD